VFWSKLLRLLFAITLHVFFQLIPPLYISSAIGVFSLLENDVVCRTLGVADKQL
jgi:hypothetical protein